ncbi:MAG TPA: NUDIX hydrolase [Candidatus Saccharimonadales bacterium]|nr:NUDIX hydrolase [Candidatus Saccharimonadales bacterium]
MKNPWKRLSTRTAYQNPWIRVREDKVIHPDGHEGIYAVVEVAPSVFIVAADGSNRVHLIECFRYSTGGMSIEIPAGGTDGEDPLKAAKRELQEETGLTGDHWKQIGELDVHNGVCREVAYIFLATGLHQTGQHEQQADGIKRTFSMPLEEVFATIAAGKIRDSESITALYLAKDHLA